MGGGENQDFSVYLSPLQGRKETGKGSRDVKRGYEREGERREGREERERERRGRERRGRERRGGERRGIATILKHDVNCVVRLAATDHYYTVVQ